MKFNPFSKASVQPLRPISAADFSKLIFQFFAVQLLIIGLIVGIYHWAGQHGFRDVQYGLFIVSLFVALFACRYFLTKIDIRRRLLDLYPDAQMPSQFQVGLMTWTPLFFIPVTVHLMLTTKKAHQALPWLYQNKRTTIATLFLTHFFVLGFATTKWPKIGRLSSPSVSYISNVSNTFQQSITAGQQMKKMVLAGQKPAFNEYFTHGNLNSTKIILGFVSYFSAVEKYRSRFPATDQDSYKAEVFKELIAYYGQWNPQNSPLTDISFVSFLSPAALVEATLIALVEMATCDVTAQKLAFKTEEFIKELPHNTQLLAGLYESPLYKSAQASRNSRLFSLLEHQLE